MGRAPCILLVDDHEHLLTTLGDYLRFEGFDVLTAPDGRQGLMRIRERSPDLIILDVSMPGMGGCEFLDRISEDGSSIYEIIWHVLEAVNWVYYYVYGEQIQRPEPILEQGAETLRALETLRRTFAAASDEELQAYRLGDRSFWGYINLPLADALHHVGQISIMRRGAGNPVRVKEEL